MLPSLALSSSSLDQFRKNVYRPRLCLLLLLVLLSPYNTSQLTSSTDAAEVSVSEPPQAGWSISVIDVFVVAAAPKASSSALPKPSSKTKAKVASTSDKAGPSAAPSPPDSKGGSSTSSQSSSQQGQPPPGSLFRFPKLSWGLIVDEHVLPALLLLHLLWAIRLAGMAVEDGLVKGSLLGVKSRFYSVTLPLIYLGVLGILAILTGQPATVAAVRSRCYTWRTQLGFDVLEPQTSESKRKLAFLSGDMMPASLFVLLELASTLVHLLSVLPKVDALSITNILPVQLRLPSPSHLPPLVEMLPIPRILKVAFVDPVTNGGMARYGRNRRPMMPPLNAGAATGPPAATRQGAPEPESATATTIANEANEATRQQVYRRVGAPDDEVLRSTSVAQPIAPLRLPENDASSTPNDAPSSSSRRRRAPRMRGQSVLVSTKWISETATALFDKVIGTLIYAVITLRLPTLTPTSLPPVLSLLSLRSELASLTQIWSRARSSVECLEFVRRRWGVQLERGQDPYASVSRPRAAAAAGDYQWKSYDDVYCAICFEQTRSADAAPSEAKDGSEAKQPSKFEFCRLDCGHELHDVCLVSWLTAQAFCPTCHVVLSFSPRATSASRRSAAQG